MIRRKERTNGSFSLSVAQGSWLVSRAPSAPPDLDVRTKQTRWRRVGGGIVHRNVSVGHRLLMHGHTRHTACSLPELPQVARSNVDR